MHFDAVVNKQKTPTVTIEALGHGFFYRATRMQSMDYAVARCLSVCPSHVGNLRVKMVTYVFKRFSPSDSQTILVFFRTKGYANIPTGTSLTGASNARGYKTSSSAVAKRLRDASCLSALIVQNVEQSFIV